MNNCRICDDQRTVKWVDGVALPAYGWDAVEDKEMCPSCSKELSDAELEKIQAGKSALPAISIGLSAISIGMRAKGFYDAKRER